MVDMGTRFWIESVTFVSDVEHKLAVKIISTWRRRTHLISLL